MRKPKIGEPVPDVALPATGGKTIRLSDLRGSKVVLYFYPKDSTPGCTMEGRDFRDNIQKFKSLKTVVLGVSRDSMQSHENFREKECLPFDLLSDEDEKLCRMFGVIKEKTMYGRKIMGIERSTFLIDENGVLRREWRGVKVDGHVAEVLATIKQA
jgi:peroxiredoxin Q/BCP